MTYRFSFGFSSITDFYSSVQVVQYYSFHFLFFLHFYYQFTRTSKDYQSGYMT